MEKLSRRDFLKVSAVGAASAAAGALFHSPANAAAKVYTPGTYSASAQGMESAVKVTTSPATP